MQLNNTKQGDEVETLNSINSESEGDETTSKKTSDQFSEINQIKNPESFVPLRR
jgi:hypothetical protein